jgi:hypothetical protein
MILADRTTDGSTTWTARMTVADRTTDGQHHLDGLDDSGGQDY